MKAGGFDLMVLDIVMGEMNGLEAHKRLEGAGMAVPAIFMTAPPQLKRHPPEVLESISLTSVISNRSTRSYCSGKFPNCIE